MKSSMLKLQSFEKEKASKIDEIVVLLMPPDLLWRRSPGDPEADKTFKDDSYENMEIIEEDNPDHGKPKSEETNRTHTVNCNSKGKQR